MSETTVLLFSKTLPNRLRYVAQFVFEEMLGLKLVFEQDIEAYQTSRLPKINYSQSPISPQELFIQCHPLLFETHIEPISINAETDFFSQAHIQTFPDFDILARIFYLLSRYEEYTADPSIFDSHDRFPAAASLAKRLGFLQQPVINQWVMQLRTVLENKFSNLKFTPPQRFSHQPTFDIDMAWKYRNKGWQRTIGGLLRDGLNGYFSEVQKRLAILRGSKRDPNDVFDYLFQIHEPLAHQPIFFFLVGDHATFDKNTHWQNQEFRQLAGAIAARYPCGLHPSYRSNLEFDILKEEKKRFEILTNIPERIGMNRPLSERSALDSISRQHFLKLRFSETYQNLIASGIKADYSLGYADDIGFRASIATPFRWFDLSKNEETDLVIHPFQVMDVTLRDYLKFSPDEAIEKVAKIIAATRQVGGTFTTLWHNSSFAEDWADWKRVYERILACSGE